MKIARWFDNMAGCYLITEVARLGQSHHER